MDKRNKKVIGAAAGAAAAATAVGIAAARMRNRKPTIYHVRPGEEDDWVVVSDGAKQPSSRHETKRVAVRAARDLAARKAPSRLVIHRRDGSVQKEHGYEPDS